MDSLQTPRCQKLVLDAGPLLSLSPLRGLAGAFYTVPQVLAELKDKRARDHFEQLGLISGVRVEIRSPDAASIAHVTQWARKTGDYAVLSQPDICVLALTYALQEEAKAAKASKETEAPQAQSVEKPLEDSLAQLSVEDATPSPQPEEEGEPSAELEEGEDEGSDEGSPTPLYNDPSDSDDGEGEWITPENVGLHKSRALELLPDAGIEKGAKKKVKTEPVEVACMTADFAMQNVLLQMGLTLVGVEGKKIERVKTWVLRCHACFKVCKDSTKKFCPSCGNPTLIRASVTLSAPGAASDAPVMQVHLKSNFQYKTRGTKYSIPAPKSGTSKTGAGEGPILREDQSEYMRAQQRADSKRKREEAKLTKGILKRGAEGNYGSTGSWMDPDWMPEIISAGVSGKGRSIRSSNMDGDMPKIGFGRKNPNEGRRRK
ncbi:hypothetical protein BDN72DRAFT_950622 [Pluteus cervinus]|uniref:Uncharacterized protein n=1 Tax=Pluteus cervinus TaxID=181527 RepID=A0ACD3AR58_9AGAR|nr:hypothetical protein BDN72DRAFT_950622 [Pluteus cervinus]